jgi:hypothetical protein
MYSAVAGSVLAMSLSVLAFCTACRPKVWLRLWRPWRDLLTGDALSRSEKKLLPGVRVRAILAGMTLMIIAAILPMAGSTHFSIIQRAWGYPPAAAEESPFSLDKLPGRSPVAVGPPAELLQRLQGPDACDKSDDSAFSGAPSPFYQPQ